jgi:hypothetical protein
MTPLVRVLAAALAAAACVAVGIGIAAAIWQGGDAPATPAAVLPTNGTSSWLFVVRAASGSVTATGGDDLTIVLRGVPPASLAFTDRPALQAAALSTSAVGAALAPDAAGYAAGAVAPLNAALAFAYEGAAVALPVTILDVAGAGGNYTLTARAMPVEGGDAVAVQGGAAVRGTSGPLWAAMQAGLELEAPAMFIDDVSAPSDDPSVSDPTSVGAVGGPCSNGTCSTCPFGCMST